MKDCQTLVDSLDDLVSLPEAYIHVRELLNDPNTDMCQFAEAIGTDPALTTRVLKIANSPFFGFAQRISSILHAVNIMGTIQLHDLVLATSVARAFNGVSIDLVDMAVFWRRSVYCGVLSRVLAIHCNALDSDRFFVAGLMHDIGHLVLFLKLPDDAGEALREARDKGEPLFQIERQRFGFTAGDVGAALMRKWRLPESFEQMVRYQHDPGDEDTLPLEASVLHLAQIAAIADEHGGLDHPCVPTPKPFALDRTGLSLETLPDLMAEAETYVAEAITCITPGLSLAASAHAS
jgi:HD-like signal output (HDOD) protein